MTEYVNVRITGEMRVRYDQTVNVPKAEFDRLSAMLESDVRKDSTKAEREIGDLFIDTSDVFDADDFELDEFTIETSASEVS